MFGFKSAQQKRIDELVAENAKLKADWEASVIELVGEHKNQVESLIEAAYGADRTAAMYKRLYEGATKALGDIAKLETPACASIGKRMARIARRELPVLHHEAGGSDAASVREVA